MKEISIFCLIVLLFVGWIWLFVKIGQDNNAYFEQCKKEGKFSDEICWQYAFK